MGKFEIKAFFSGWREVSKEKAIDYARSFYNGITAVSDHNERCEITQGHIRGIEVKEVIKKNY